MAFHLDLYIEAITFDSTQAVIVDSSDYTESDAPVRGNYAAFISGFKKINNASDKPLVFESFLPESATSFTFDLDGDAWYQFRYCLIPEFVGLTAYVENDAVYNPNDQLVYRATQAVPDTEATITSTYWEVVESPTDLIENDDTIDASANIYSVVFDTLLIPDLKRKLGKLTKEAAATCHTCEIDFARDVQMRLTLAINAIEIFDNNAAYAKGALLINKAKEISRQC